MHIVKLYNILQDNVKITHFHTVHVPADLSAVYTRWLLDLDEHRPSELQHIFVKKYIIFFLLRKILLMKGPTLLQQGCKTLYLGAEKGIWTAGTLILSV